MARITQDLRISALPVFYLPQGPMTKEGCGVAPAAGTADILRRPPVSRSARSKTVLGMGKLERFKERGDSAFLSRHSDERRAAKEQEAEPFNHEWESRTSASGSQQPALPLLLHFGIQFQNAKGALSDMDQERTWLKSNGWPFWSATTMEQSAYGKCWCVAPS